MTVTFDPFFNAYHQTQLPRKDKVLILDLKMTHFPQLPNQIGLPVSLKHLLTLSLLWENQTYFCTKGKSKLYEKQIAYILEPVYHFKVKWTMAAKIGPKKNFYKFYIKK